MKTQVRIRTLDLRIPDLPERGAGALTHSATLIGSDCMHTWQLYSATSLGNQAASIMMTQYATQSYYPDTELTRHYLILLMQSARLGSDKYQLFKSLPLTRAGTELPTSRALTHNARTQPIRPPCPVLSRGEKSMLEVFVS